MSFERFRADSSGCFRCLTALAIRCLPTSTTIRLFVCYCCRVSKLKHIIQFFSLIGEYDHGFYTLSEPPFVSPSQWNKNFIASQRALKLICCDAGYVMQPLFNAFKHIIITSGTLSLDLYPKLLQFHPLVAKSICIDRNSHLCPVVVSRGNDQVGPPFLLPYVGKNDSHQRDGGSSQQQGIEPHGSQERCDAFQQVHAASEQSSRCVVWYFLARGCYEGSLLVEMARVVPDGIICFFTSYSHIS